MGSVQAMLLVPDGLKEVGVRAIAMMPTSEVLQSILGRGHGGARPSGPLQGKGGLDNQIGLVPCPWSPGNWSTPRKPSVLTTGTQGTVEKLLRETIPASLIYVQPFS